MMVRNWSASRNRIMDILKRGDMGTGGRGDVEMQDTEKITARSWSPCLRVSVSPRPPVPVSLFYLDRYSGDHPVNRVGILGR